MAIPAGERGAYAKLCDIPSGWMPLGTFRLPCCTVQGQRGVLVYDPGAAAGQLRWLYLESTPAQKGLYMSGSYLLA